MKKSITLSLCGFLLWGSVLSGQIIEEKTTTSALSLAENCPSDPCPCQGGYTEMQVYYLGADNAQVDVFADNDLTDLITSFPVVNQGDLLVIDGTGLPGGTLGTYTYFRVTPPAADPCTTEIFSRCPSNVWPGALDDLKVVGKTFRDFVVFSVTDEGNSVQCTVDDVDQDWHVGGNIVGPGNKILGTLNDEDVVWVTNATERGIITRTGDFGINTTTPSARLDVQGDAIVNETLDVNGQARINDASPATDATTGALTVAGGVGITQNLYVGPMGLTRLQNTTASSSATSGALVVGGGVGIGEDLYVDDNLDVTGTATIDGYTQVDDDAEITGNLELNGDLAMGPAGEVNLVYNSISEELLVENQQGNIRFEAADEEMMIISDAQVEVKKRIIVTGADLAERFTVNTKLENNLTQIRPGMVVAIDTERPGELVVSRQAYDRTVAGVVSGAGGVQTALLLGQEGSIADGDVPVAVVGRVYCYVDAAYGAIAPGDLLTTSPTYGHAMKVTDHDQARGAIIGKAMTALPQGKGLVLVLISMQ